MTVKLLPAIRPNAGAQANYERKLGALIDEMNDSIDYWIKAAYRANEPHMAADASPAMVLREALQRLRRRWQKKFDELAPKLSRKFVSNATGPTDAAFMRALRDAGFTVRPVLSRRVNDVLQAAVGENVSLIKSIPEQHFTRVEGMVMRSVQAGRDVGGLSRDLQTAFGITRRRAAFIARDQNNKASAVIQRARRLDLGLTTAIWLHSGGGHHPRPKHLAFSGKEYDIREGAPIGDKGQKVHPGEEPGCFTGDMPVSIANGLLHVWRTAFNGPMVYCRVGPHLLKGTPNHPVLTSRGWVPLGVLENGDKIIRVRDNGRDVVDNQVNETIPRFVDLFESLSRVFGHDSLNGSGFNFYGNVPDGDVDQISICDGFLTFYDKIVSSQNIGDFKFTETDTRVFKTLLSVMRHVLPADILRLSDLFLANGGKLPGGFDVISFAPAADFHACLAQNVLDIRGRGFGKTQMDSDCGRAETFSVQTNDFILETAPINSAVRFNTASAEGIAEYISREPDFSGGVFEFGTVIYEVDCVTEKVIRDYSGHVYTVETLNGFYSVSGGFIQAKNCRCTSRIKLTLSS